MSLGIHESQSRLWENIVGRSRAFWDVYYGQLQTTFPGTLDDVFRGRFLPRHQQGRAVVYPCRGGRSDVLPSCDDSLRDRKAHGRGRFGGRGCSPQHGTRLSRNTSASFPRTTQKGVCRMSTGRPACSVTSRPNALGTMLASQLYDKALAENPDIKTDLDKGEFASLLSWLRTNVHAPGRRYPARRTRGARVRRTGTIAVVPEIPKRQVPRPLRLSAAFRYPARSHP